MNYKELLDGVETTPVELESSSEDWTYFYQSPVWRDIQHILDDTFTYHSVQYMVGDENSRAMGLAALQLKQKLAGLGLDTKVTERQEKDDE